LYGKKAGLSAPVLNLEEVKGKLSLQDKEIDPSKISNYPF